MLVTATLEVIAVAMAVPEVDTETAPVVMAVAVVATPEVVANQVVAMVVTAAEGDPLVATNQDLKEVAVLVVLVALRLKTALSSLETLAST